jgi:hypothetical protein
MLMFNVAALAQSALGAITVSTVVDVGDLINALVGPGVTVLNPEMSGGPQALGLFEDTSDPPIFGFSSGIALGTGSAKNIIVGPNDSNGTSLSYGLPGDADLDALIGLNTFDATTLEFDFVCEEGDGLSFGYVFGSDEYNEYVGTIFNDVFAFFLNGINIALLPDGKPVNIDNVNGDNPNFVDNTGKVKANTEFDGYTKLLYTNAIPSVGDGAVNHLKIVIADVGDASYDSAVIIKAMSLECVAPPAPEITSPSTSPNGQPSSSSSSATSSESVSSRVCKNFAVHARTTITFDGVLTTILGGDVSVSPGTATTGTPQLEDGQVVEDSADFAASVLVAHTEAMREPAEPMFIEIGGLTFTPGTHRSDTSMNFAYGTVVTLDGLGETDPVFLFQARSTLVTAADTYFILKNGAKAENVLWVLGTAATLGANSTVEGSILAGTAITFGTKSVLHGCALAQSAVTFESEGTVDVTQKEDGTAEEGSTRHLRGLN